jgi:hypothetical protein
MQSNKPTMFDLWQQFPGLNEIMIREAGVDRRAIAAVFLGAEVTQEEFEAVLNTFNRFAGTQYTQEDIAGVKIVPQEALHERLVEEAIFQPVINVPFSRWDVIALDTIVSSYMQLVTLVIPVSKERNILIKHLRQMQAHWREAVPPFPLYSTSMQETHRQKEHEERDTNASI